MTGRSRRAATASGRRTRASSAATSLSPGGGARTRRNESARRLDSGSRARLLVGDGRSARILRPTRLPGTDGDGNLGHNLIV